MTCQFQVVHTAIFPTKAFSFQQTTGETDGKIQYSKKDTFIGRITASLSVSLACSRPATSSHFTFGVSLNIALDNAPRNFAVSASISSSGLRIRHFQTRGITLTFHRSRCRWQLPLRFCGSDCFQPWQDDLSIFLRARDIQRLFS